MAPIPSPITLTSSNPHAVPMTCTDEPLKQCVCGSSAANGSVGRQHVTPRTNENAGWRRAVSNGSPVTRSLTSKVGTRGALLQLVLAAKR